MVKVCALLGLLCLLVGGCGGKSATRTCSFRAALHWAVLQTAQQAPNAWALATAQAATNQSAVAFNTVRQAERKYGRHADALRAALSASWAHIDKAAYWNSGYWATSEKGPAENFVYKAIIQSQMAVRSINKLRRALKKVC